MVLISGFGFLTSSKWNLEPICRNRFLNVEPTLSQVPGLIPKSTQFPPIFIIE